MHRDPYAFCPDEPEETLDIACEFCLRVLPCDCGRREAAGRQHLLVRDGNAPAQRVPKTHGELLAALAQQRGENALLRSDLRDIVTRLDTLIEHGEHWTWDYLRSCLRELRTEAWIALS